MPSNAARTFHHWASTGSEHRTALPLTDHVFLPRVPVNGRKKESAARANKVLPGGLAVRLTTLAASKAVRRTTLRPSASTTSPGGSRPKKRHPPKPDRSASWSRVRHAPLSSGVRRMGLQGNSKCIACLCLQRMPLPPVEANQSRRSWTPRMGPSPVSRVWRELVALQRR